MPVSERLAVCEPPLSLSLVSARPLARLEWVNGTADCGEGDERGLFTRGKSN